MVNSPMYDSVYFHTFISLIRLTFRTAKAMISGIEVMHMVKKGQLVLQDKSAQNQVKIIHKLFGIAT
jgi:hypothetical protein